METLKCLKWLSDMSDEGSPDGFLGNPKFLQQLGWRGPGTLIVLVSSPGRRCRQGLRPGQRPIPGRPLGSPPRRTAGGEIAKACAAAADERRQIGRRPALLGAAKGLVDLSGDDQDVLDGT